MNTKKTIHITSNCIINTKFNYQSFIHKVDDATTTAGTVVGAGGGGLAGAGTGAVIGTVVCPGLGTLLGAGVGALAGGAAGGALGKVTGQFVVGSRKLVTKVGRSVLGEDKNKNKKNLQPSAPSIEGSPIVGQLRSGEIRPAITDEIFDPPPYQLTDPAITYPYPTIQNPNEAPPPYEEVQSSTEKTSLLYPALE